MVHYISEFLEKIESQNIMYITIVKKSDHDYNLMKFQIIINIFASGKFR